MVRILSLLILFGLGAEALGGGPVGVIVSAAISLFLNRVWKEQERRQLERAHREAVIADEDLRLEVRERRAKP